MFSGARSAWDDRASGCAARKRDFSFNGGIAARVDNLARVDFGDLSVHE
jgi:hypothetical protein